MREIIPIENLLKGKVIFRILFSIKISTFAFRKIKIKKHHGKPGKPIKHRAFGRNC